jgi:hypothetical protein
MHPAPDDFDMLRKLLALKRHEQPPPGFYDHLARQVMAQISAKEIALPIPWWQQLLGGLDLKPALTGAFGLAVIGMYFFGLSLAGYVDQPAARPSVAMIETWHPAVPLPSASFSAESAERQLVNLSETAMPSSMSPLITAGAPQGLFSPGAGMRGTKIDRAGFKLPPN